MFKNRYANKRVLVTGHTGFKGSWLTLWLLRLGAKVSGFSSYLPSSPCNYEVLRLKERIKDYSGDVRNLGDL
ncbi:MAG: CDP-glucose 4,6-dehydratase, partial [Candidatus Thorarchaeota archaeon]